MCSVKCSSPHCCACGPPRVQATQRTGRAGRTRPGKCFRLYTRAFFDKDMLPETVPEVLRTSLQAAVLHLKTLPLDVDVLHFEYMDPPKVPPGPLALQASV